MDIFKKTIAEIKRLLDEAGSETRELLIQQLVEDHRAGIQKLVASYRAEVLKTNAVKNKYTELCKYEQKLNSRGFKLIAGVDEAGRGALAGPIVAASVILPPESCLYGLKDSKQLSPEQREKLYDRVVDTAVTWNVASIGNDLIDKKGIQWANITVLERAVLGLRPTADYVLSDAFALSSLDIPCLSIIKGDSLSASIAAASIIAKVTRDRMMSEYDSIYPEYGFAQHKGYGTLQHKDAIEKYGVLPIHRKYFLGASDSDQLSFL